MTPGPTIRGPFGCACAGNSSFSPVYFGLGSDANRPAATEAMLEWSDLGLPSLGCCSSEIKTIRDKSGVHCSLREKVISYVVDAWLGVRRKLVVLLIE